MRLTASLALIALLPAAVFTAAALDNTGVSSMRVKLEQEEVRFVEPHYRAYVTVDSNQFAFRLPVGYRISGDPATGTLTLANREGNGSVTFTISEPMPPETAKLDPNSFRETLLQEYPKGSIAQEFWRNNAGGGGPGFDLEWKESGQLVKCKRIVYMSSAAGVLQFTVTGSRRNFPALQSDLDAIILSLKCTTDGTKPKVPPLLDRT